MVKNKKRNIIYEMILKVLKYFFLYVVLPIICLLLGKPFAGFVIVTFYKLTLGFVNVIDSCKVPMSYKVVHDLCLTMTSIPWLLGLSYYFGRLGYKQLAFMTLIVLMSGVLGIVFRGLYITGFYTEIMIHKTDFPIYFFIGLILGSIIGTIAFRRNNQALSY